MDERLIIDKIKWQELTIQQKLELIKLKRAKISQEMISCDLGTSDPKSYARLYKKAELLDQRIKEIQDSIQPAQGHGVMSQFFLRFINGLEPHRFKK